jgi:hypothetical protein
MGFLYVSAIFRQAHDAKNNIAMGSTPFGGTNRKVPLILSFCFISITKNIQR